MSKIKREIKKLLSIKTQLKLAVYFIGLIVWISAFTVMGTNIYRFISDPLNQDKMISAVVNVPRAEAEEKVYKYNEQVPIDVVRLEIVKQARDFGNDKHFMLDLAFMESEFDNLAKNPNSTALGIYQFLIGTWQETDSFKLERKARTDYKANIKEANIAISKGEHWRWKETINKMK